jgi:hypothetical protein
MKDIAEYYKVRREIFEDDFIESYLRQIDLQLYDFVCLWQYSSEEKMNTLITDTIEEGLE